jgi:transposase
VGVVSRDVISDETWVVIGPLFPQPKATGRPPADRRQVVEATAWRSDKTARSYHAALCLTAALYWLDSSLSSPA